MKKEEILAQMGLEKREAAIYLALLESGSSTVSTIAKKTGIHRPIIYKFLPSLLEKHLISVVPKGRQKLFVAESPDNLAKLLDGLTVEFEKVLPELQSTFRAREKKPLVKFLEGKAAIRTIFEDLVHTLAPGSVFYRYSSRKDLTKGSEYIPANYRLIRDRKKLERFVITSEEVAKLKKPRLERSVKIVPKEFGLFDYDVSQIIYDDKVAIIDDNSDTAFIVENKMISEFQKKIFKILFSKL